MILGTVQLGLNYGVNNRAGKPSGEQAYKILDTAYENGIRMLDTGPMYGNSEEIIGSYLQEKGNVFIINTKLPDTVPDEQNLMDSYVEEALQTSLKRLNVDRVYCYYLHQYDQCKNHRLMELLVRARDKKQIEKIGVSIYHPEEMLYICENLKDIVDVVQIPYNIFSVTLWEEALERAKEAKIIVYARSLFLQGLAFLSPGSTFSINIGASKYISYVQELAEQRGQEIEQTCYDAVIKNPIITDVIFGVETTGQLLRNLRLEERYMTFSEGQWNGISDVMKDIPRDIVDPTTWGKYK
ncbi:MAG: aldo/keto reductase [Lachnospiraceae bacterium]|nr:aldo/keto reductase [Lachnospiraceae bacterium]